jgi:hypothetical protein
MTKDEAYIWFAHARDALDYLGDGTREHDLFMARRSLTYGNAATAAQSVAFEEHAKSAWAVAREAPEWSRAVCERDARVLGFCAAVLRATVDDEQGPDLAAESACLRARVAELEAGLREAVGEFQDALTYVDDFFREKWGYDAAIAKAEALAAGTQKDGEGGQ